MHSQKVPVFRTTLTDDDERRHRSSHKEVHYTRMKPTAPSWRLRRYGNLIVNRLFPLRKTQIDGLKFRYFAAESPPQDPREFADTGLEFHHRISELSGWEAIDVGANIGSYTLRLARRFHSVTAFEPSPAHSKVLRLNIALNSLKNVHVREVALSDVSGISPLYIRAGATSLDMSHYGLGYDSVCLVKTAKLDEYETKFTKLDLVKIDAENLEYAILKGGIGMISKFRPVIAVEVHRSRVLSNGSCICDVCKLLQSHRYDTEVTGESSSIGMVHWVWATPSIESMV